MHYYIYSQILTNKKARTPHLKPIQSKSTWGLNCQKWGICSFLAKGLYKNLLNLG